MNNNYIKTESQSLNSAAVGLLGSGLSVIPVNADKTPAVSSWKKYQKQALTIGHVEIVFSTAEGIAVIGGAGSGNLECIDFDNPTLFQPFLDTLEGINPPLAAKLVQRKTPNGFHLIYRCREAVSGNEKLAVEQIEVDGPGNHPCPWRPGKEFQARESNGKWYIEPDAIETRGEGGYFLTAPTPGYEVIRHSLKETPVITGEERAQIRTLARSFNEQAIAPKVGKKTVSVEGKRPGDAFNKEWEREIPVLLEKHGWKNAGRTGPGGQHWIRPGKDKGTSATLENGCFYVFTCNGGKLEQEKSYSAFGLLSELEFNGDYQAAAKYLLNNGYSEPCSISSHGTALDEVEFELKKWPELSPKALYGFAGRFVEFATRNSEADPAAVLATFLVRFGVELSEPCMWIGDAKHKSLLAAVIVGSSSKARKGTSAKPVMRLFEPMVFGDGVLSLDKAKTTPGPFSSGEGIIYAVRDQQMGLDKKGEPKIIDPGVDDKRLFVADEEFAGAMAQTKRDGNTLSMVIRTAWDGSTLDPLTKTSKIKATNPHIGWVSHITLFELNTRLNETEIFNGYANRILWVCAKRSKLVALPEPMDSEKLSEFQYELAQIIAANQGEVSITPTKEVKDLWRDKYYYELSQDRPGKLGCVTNRAEAQVLRLAMVYCLLDKSKRINVNHLEAALAFWEYCSDSARYIFGGRQADNISQQILDALKNGPLTATEINRLFHSHVSKPRLEEALSQLVASDKVAFEKQSTGGRPTTRYFLKPLSVKSVISVKTPDIQEQTELNTLNTLNTQSENKKTPEVYEVEI